ncbi:LysE family translocator [Agaribacter marinus]|uniref:LysE family translocator n=1 Tax=Agaribacter marinus TaxID=1431249 RepID=UPI0024E19204|nr:LysE family translocator [Agaribacter marinus]
MDSFATAKNSIVEKVVTAMSLFIAMCLYSISMSVSPGPVNLITFASAINFGVHKTMPFVSGATVGFVFLLLFVGLGFHQLFTFQHDAIEQGFTIVSCLFIAYIGYKIATADVTLSRKSDEAPRFFSGFMLQWLNPKAWLACVAGISAFELNESLEALLGFISIYFICCYPCLALWAVAGHKMRNVMKQKSFLQILNRLTGAVLIIIATYLLLSNFIAIGVPYI